MQSGQCLLPWRRWSSSKIICLAISRKLNSGDMMGSRALHAFSNLAALARRCWIRGFTVSPSAQQPEPIGELPLRLVGYAVCGAYELLA